VQVILPPQNYTIEAARNFGFDELCALIRRLGFSERKGKGGHRIFYREDIEEIITLQPARSQAKPYQVRQGYGT
jgi:predicted RNA binding protein YcfA (HicA-like mRNA interferase family)